MKTPNKPPRQVSRPTPATPIQLAMFGHVAATLRDYMHTHGITTISALGERIGLPPGSVSLYSYVNAKTAPTKAMRIRISRGTGIPETELMPRSKVPGGTVAMPGNPLPSLPVRTRATPLASLPVSTPEDRTPRPRDVLSFTVADNGMATLGLQATLPLDTAVPLLRILLDAGLVLSKQNHDENKGNEK